jgi:hypothetical protein
LLLLDKSPRILSDKLSNGKIEGTFEPEKERRSAFELTPSFAIKVKFHTCGATSLASPTFVFKKNSNALENSGVTFARFRTSKTSSAAADG